MPQYSYLRKGRDFPMATIKDVLDTNLEHAIDIVVRALRATNWKKFLITEKAEIRIPKKAGRVLNISRDEIAKRYLSYEQLSTNPPPNFHRVQHPMIDHKVTLARKVETGEAEFERLIDEISLALSVYATADLKTEEITITTPLCEATGMQIAGLKPSVIPVWRAGEGMKHGLRIWLTQSRVGNVGMYRNHKTLLPIIYYAKMLVGMKEILDGKVAMRPAYVCDPMLATGVSAVATIEILKSFGYRKIKFISVLAAPQGVNAVLMAHPDVEIYTAALDCGLDTNGYIIPGLGDAGKRLNGTDWDEDFDWDEWNALVERVDALADAD